MHNELPWIWWELGSLLLLEEWAFPVFTKSVQFSQEKLETATICPGPCISPKSPKAETVGLRGCCEGPPLMHLPCRQTEPWTGMEKAPRAQKDCREKDEEIWETCLPSLPLLWSVLASQHKHSRLANQTQLPHCCHGLKTSTSPSSTRPGAGGACFSLLVPLLQCSRLPFLPTLPYPQRVKSSSSYLFAFSKVSTFFQSSLFSVVYVSTLWE